MKRNLFRMNYYNFVFLKINIKYRNIDELKDLVKRFHEVGIKVLGDAVLNHRCAHYQNQNGMWNIFGGPLNWDDRSVVADDPHFEVLCDKSPGHDWETRYAS
ncbi:hypothetical protein GLYMA_11G153301v4 [Glycine max]|nr:hypothetical protein GLYMA_11G153301v4 [Glycine max]KAH1159559.1 hypothetical protein GYH30_031333 [Glycine max]